MPEIRAPRRVCRHGQGARAAGGIAATFNGPITGVFFGVEIILREFSVEAIFTVMLSAMVADLVSRQFLGDAPFLSGLPAGISLHHLTTYLLIAGLAVVAALIGIAFAKILYATEDLCDRVWRNRPEWARPAVGGILLGLLLLLALPQMYGVGYPVLYKAVGGSYALWFLIILAAGKIIACSLTIGIGGSGGVFAPSLFIGATSGMAFGEIAHHLIGPAAGQPALYAVVAMGAVFAAAARAPLTSVASVVEMTGDFTLTLPVMLAVAIATATSRALSYGTIYTTKLLRRGIDIDHVPSADPFEDLTAADAMRAFQPALPADPGPGAPAAGYPALPGPVTGQLPPQVLFATESLTQAVRQLELYGRDGLPVISDDGQRLQGWLTTATCCRPSPARSAPPGTAARRHRRPPDRSSPARRNKCRRPPRRWGPISCSRSPSRPARPPRASRSAASPGRPAVSRSRSWITAPCATPIPASAWPRATASPCSPPQHAPRRHHTRAAASQHPVPRMHRRPGRNCVPRTAAGAGRRTIDARPGRASRVSAQPPRAALPSPGNGSAASRAASTCPSPRRVAGV